MTLKFLVNHSIRCLTCLLFMLAPLSVSAKHYVDKQQQQRFIKEFVTFQFSPLLILTSNYVWRGVSQSDNHPALQGNFLLHDKLGLYAGLFGTNVNFPGTNGKPVTSEFQLYTGYQKKYAEFRYDVGIRRYIYPNAIGPDFTEGFIFLGYRIFTAGIARSNEVPTLYGDNGTYHGTYYSAQALYKLPFKLSDDSLLSHLKVGAHVGRYNFSSSNLRDNSYTDYRLFINKRYKLATFELSWTDTNNDQAFLGQITSSILALSIMVCW